MPGLTYYHVTDEGTVEIAARKARILIESRYQPSVHEIMMNDLNLGRRITVRKGYVEALESCAEPADE